MDIQINFVWSPQEEAETGQRNRKSTCNQGQGWAEGGAELEEEKAQSWKDMN